MVTSGDIIAYANEFKDLPPEKIELYISYAQLSIPPEKWAEKTKFATVLLTCHLLKLALAAEAIAGSGGTGPVTSEKVGDLARSYGSSSGGGGNSGGNLGQTSYGQEFLRLQKSLIISPMVIT